MSIYIILLIIGILAIIIATLYIVIRKNSRHAKFLSNLWERITRRNLSNKDRTMLHDLQTRYDLMPEGQWRHQPLQQHEPRHIYLSVDVPIEHDEYDIYLFCADIDERTANLLCSHDTAFQQVAVPNESKRFRFRNPLINSLSTIDDVALHTSTDDSNPLQLTAISTATTLFDELIRHYAIGPVPDHTAFLHYQPELTRRSFQRADAEGATPYIVYSVYYPITTTSYTANDYLDQIIGPIHLDQITDEQYLLLILRNYSELISLIHNTPESYFNTQTKEEYRREFEVNKRSALEYLRRMKAPPAIIDQIEKLTLETRPKTVLIIDKNLELFVPGYVVDRTNAVTMLSETDRLEDALVNRDLDRIPIRLSPLSKTLYFFYLRHPEGVAFKHLVDYTDELRELYSLLSHRENLGTMQRSIYSLTDATSNSVNEKCSRIKFAFYNAYPSALLHDYCILGQAGQPRYIKLERALIDDLSGLILNTPAARGEIAIAHE